MQACHGSMAGILRDLALACQRADGVGNRLAGLARTAGAGIVHHHGDTALRGDLGNAAAHQAGADDAQQGGAGSCSVHGVSCVWQA